MISNECFLMKEQVTDKGVEAEVEGLVEGGVVFGAEAEGLIVFVLVPSFGEADLSREEIHPETLEWLERKSDW